MFSKRTCISKLHSDNYLLFQASYQHWYESINTRKFSD